MSDTLMAIIAACAIIAAVLMAGLAYRLNEKWGEREKKWIEIAEKQNSNAEYQNRICERQNEIFERQNYLTGRMNREWHAAYIKMVNMKVEVAGNERD